MKIRLTAHKFEMTSELEKYANGKVAHVAKQVPRDTRAGASCEVQFAQSRKKGAKFNTCSIVFTLDDTELKAEETTLHMYSALDIAAVHIEHQLVDHVARQETQSVRARLKRGLQADWQ